MFAVLDQNWESPFSTVRGFVRTHLLVNNVFSSVASCFVECNNNIDSKPLITLFVSANGHSTTAIVEESWVGHVLGDTDPPVPTPSHLEHNDLVSVMILFIHNHCLISGAFGSFDLLLGIKLPGCKVSYTPNFIFCRPIQFKIYIFENVSTWNQNLLDSHAYCWNHMHCWTMQDNVSEIL